MVDESDQTQSPLLPRVFLSLSASDEDFVHKVERNLIHGIAFLYTRSFRTGDDMIEVMEKHVRASWLFVLFASEDSLRSKWVQFEIDQARLGHINRPDHKVLVFPASPTIKASDLPDWMRRFWFDTSGRSAKDIARYINNHLRFGLLRPHVYGRGRLLDRGLGQYAESLARVGVCNCSRRAR